MWDLKIKQQAHRYRDRLAVARGRSWALGEMGEGTQRYTISVIVNKSWDVIYIMTALIIMCKSISVTENNRE